jgi:hypothetical protein
LEDVNADSGLYHEAAGGYQLQQLLRYHVICSLEIHFLFFDSDFSPDQILSHSNYHLSSDHTFAVGVLVPNGNFNALRPVFSRVGKIPATIPARLTHFTLQPGKKTPAVVMFEVEFLIYYQAID